MVYLSQLLNKNVYYKGKTFGKILDFAIFENRPVPPVSKIEIKHGKEKLTVAPSALIVKDNRLELRSDIPFLPYDHKDFYLGEDLLDKQVIDTDGRRLVRANDVVLDDSNGELKVTGIDIGFAGILRRLGVTFWSTTTILPWSVIEAFDYQTGTVRIKLKQSSLNTLHPADIANILEDVGTKERVGIVSVLEAKKAARAIEETDDQTQVSILENLKEDYFKNIIEKMHLAEVADVMKYLNPLKAKQVQSALGQERAQKVKKLISFPDNVAGGIMHLSVFKMDGDKTIKQVLKEFEEVKNIPETIIVTNGGGKISGIVLTKDLLFANDESLLKKIITEKKFVSEKAPMTKIVRLFAQYNLRALPVIDTEKKPVGIILIDDLVKIIEEESRENENL